MTFTFFHATGPDSGTFVRVNASNEIAARSCAARFLGVATNRLTTIKQEQDRERNTKTNRA